MYTRTFVILFIIIYGRGVIVSYIDDYKYRQYMESCAAQGKRPYKCHSEATNMRRGSN